MALFLWHIMKCNHIYGSNSMGLVAHVLPKTRTDAAGNFRKPQPKLLTGKACNSELWDRWVG
jgi:hypothetical protein